MVKPTDDKDELDKQFDAYNNQSDDQKLQADNTSLSLYGMTNYDHYNKLISQLPEKDGSIEEAVDFISSYSQEFLDNINCKSDKDLKEKVKQAKDNNENVMGCVIVYPAENANLLSSTFLKYMALDKENKLLSDQKCKELFGKTNRELYRYLQNSTEFKTEE